jgi:branched-chain amino acid transport system substrate-binding protein
VANELQVPIFANGSSNEILATGPWAFKVMAFATEIMGPLSKFTVQSLKVKRIALVTDQGNDGYMSQKAEYLKGIKAAGVQIISDDYIVSTESNFIALATKLATQGADAVFIATPAELAANLVIQIKQAGIDPKTLFLGPSTLASANYIKIGGKAVEGTYAISDYSPASTAPLNATFVKTYTERYKVPPDVWAALGYSIGQIAGQAVRNVGPSPTRQRLRDELAKLNNVSVPIGNGSWSVNAARHPNYGGVLLQVKNGVFVTVAQP